MNPVAIDAGSPFVMSTTENLGLILETTPSPTSVSAEPRLSPV